jgi:hypothetical protein
MLCEAGKLNAPGSQLDHKENIDGLEPEHFHGENSTISNRSQ